MSWVRVDDNITFHRKVVHCGNEAFGAWMRMVAWSANHLTDGAIPKRIALLIAEKEKVVDLLVEVGLLELAEDGFAVHDYHEHNPKSADVKAKRRAESERKAAGRAHQVRAESGRITADVRKMSARNPAGQNADVRAESGRTSTGPIPSHPIPSQSQEEDPEETLPDLPAGDSVLKPAELALVPTEPPVTASDLEQAYRAYPRKEGKSKGLERLKSQIKTRDDLALLKRAIANYAEQVRLDGTAEQFVRHFDTWTSSWRDWIAWAPKARGSPIQSAPRRGYAEPMAHVPEGQGCDDVKL